jgi:hypothetical protein
LRRVTEWRDFVSRALSAVQISALKHFSPAQQYTSATVDGDLSKVTKMIRIERQLGGADASSEPEIWKTIPNGERVRVWENSTAESIDPATGNASLRHLFHIRHMPLISRGNRVTYFGQKFRVLDVSDSSRLLGLELLCEPV